MGLRDRIEGRHPDVLAAEAEAEAANIAKIEAKRAELADDSGGNTTVPPDKRCV